MRGVFLQGGSEAGRRTGRILWFALDSRHAFRRAPESQCRRVQRPMPAEVTTPHPNR